MNVVCIFKWARNPDDAWVEPDGSITWRRPKLVATDDDAAAIVAARELAQSTGGTLVGVTVGDGDAAWAFSRGADRVVSVSGFTPGPDDGEGAAALASAVRRAGEADVVVMGDAVDHPGVAGVLGALLSMPVLPSVDEVTVDPTDPRRVLVRRRAGTIVETIAAPSPVLVAVAAASGEKDPPGVREQLAARKRPIEMASLSEAGAPAANNVAVAASRVPPTSSARLFEGDIAQASRELVAALRADHVL